MTTFAKKYKPFPYSSKWRRTIRGANFLEEPWYTQAEMVH